ncbi:jg17614, partial [Pararge aegeria aegeria]
EKAEAMAKAQQYLTAKNYPSWVHVARIPQGTEPAIFKQYFTTWRDVGMSHSRIVRSAGTGQE